MPVKNLYDEMPSGTEVNVLMGKQIDGGAVGSANFVDWARECSIAGVISKLSLNVDVAPGAGQSVTAILYKNNLSTGLTVILSGAGVTYGMDSVNEVFFTATDQLALMIIRSATAASSQYNWG